MNNARGEYVIHADPDDWVEPNMLEELYGKAKEENADMIICDVWRDTSNQSTYVKQRLFILEHCVMLKDVLQQI